MTQAPFFGLSGYVRLLVLRGTCFSSRSALSRHHDGIRGNGRSHLSRAVVETPHEFPRSHPDPSSTPDASSSAEEVGLSTPCGSGRRTPAELSCIPPHAMKYDGELARYRDDRLLHAPPPGNSDAPHLERVPAAPTGQQDQRRFVEARSHHDIAATRDPPGPRRLAGLVETWREPEVGPDTFRS